jgi:glycosyltransferase involved in cell wall biosynthesis
MSAGSDHSSDHSGAALRIGVVTETYPPEINGVANTMRHLAEGLARRGHAVELVRPRQPGERVVPGEADESPRIDHILVPGVPIPGYRGLRFGLPVFWRLRRLWRLRPPDVVYIATQGPLGHAALAAARLWGIPSVTGFHTQFHQYSRHYGLGLLTGPIVRILQHFHNRSDATLVPTQELEAELTAQGFANVHLFGRGVDLGLFSPARRDPALRVAWGCRADGLAVLYVGRVAAEKNLDLAREAFEAIESSCPGARFVVVGDGPALAHLQRDHPRFVCTGARVGEALAAHYASGDLFLFPSLTETFGNVVPEAMASALPVVAFDYAAAHAAIVSGVNGVTVPIEDRAGFVAAAARIAQDRPGLRAMGAAARRTAEGMSWERVLGGVEDRLRAVVRRRCVEGAHETLAGTTD